MAWKKIIVSGSQAELSNLVVDSNVTASNLQISGDANIEGNLVLGGNITIGDNTSDNIILGGEISSSIIPDADGTYDLGSDAKRWSNVYGDTIYGDGSNLTNITVSQAATVASSFTNQTSVAVTHNFDSKNVAVTVYNSSDQLILPASVTLTSNDVATITFDSSTSGRVVIAKGGHIVSGSVSADNIDGLDAKIADLGYAVTSSNTFTADQTFQGHLIPFASSSYDLGSTAKPWRDLYISTASIKFIDETGTITKQITGENAVTTDNFKTQLNSETVVSGSSQIDLTSTTNYASGIKSQLDAEGVISSSAQIGDGILSSSAEGDAQGQIKLNNVNIDINGLQTNDSPQFTNLILTGDLTVQGTTTSIETANLLVEDKFILLNSGSANPDQGGIIIDEGSGTGHAFIYNNTAARFGFTSSLSSTATSVTPDAFAAAVIDIDAGHTDIAEYQKNGNIKTDSGTVYIYA
jgi:hypothetical protein